MATANLIDIDQNWQEESTTTWYALDGKDYGTGMEFESDVYGIVDCNGFRNIVDRDGIPLTPGDGLYIAVKNTLKLEI